MCPAKNRKKAPHTRFVLRPNDQDLFDEVQARMRDPTFGQKMSERMWKCEGLFAEAKQNLGLARAGYRGRQEVQIQAYLSATAQNLKRLVFLFHYWLVARWSPRRGKATPSRSRSLAAELFQQARWFSGTRHECTRRSVHLMVRRALFTSSQCSTNTDPSSTGCSLRLR